MDNGYLIVGQAGAIAHILAGKKLATGKNDPQTPEQIEQIIDFIDFFILITF